MPDDCRQPSFTISPPDTCMIAFLGVLGSIIIVLECETTLRCGPCGRRGSHVMKLLAEGESWGLSFRPLLSGNRNLNIPSEFSARYATESSLQ